MFGNKNLFFLTFFIALITMFIAIIIPEYFKVPYAFYNIIRLLAFSSLGYITYYLFIKKNLILSFFLAIPTIMYNPLTPIFLTRNIWMGVDIIIILMLLVVIFNINKKTNVENFDNNDCIIFNELKKLIEYSKQNTNSYNEKHAKIKLIGVTIGGFNKHFLERLYKNKNVDFPNTSVFELIKYLANNNIYNKDIINDLHSLNDLRNRIVHDEDRTPITPENIDFFEKLTMSSVDKAEFLYRNGLKNNS
jgi:hypothetical protein